MGPVAMPTILISMMNDCSCGQMITLYDSNSRAQNIPKEF